MAIDRNFFTDLQSAKKTERKVAEYFSCLNEFNIVQYDNVDNRYDIIVQDACNVNHEIEIKEDFMAQKTGNIMVEFECRGKPSGIAVTQASHYGYVIHEPNGQKNLYIISVDELKELIANQEYKREVIGGDPGSNTKGYLFSLDLVKDKFFHELNFNYHLVS